MKPGEGKGGVVLLCICLEWNMMLNILSGVGNLRATLTLLPNSSVNLMDLDSLNALSNAH